MLPPYDVAAIRAFQMLPPMMLSPMLLPAIRLYEMFTLTMRYVCCYD